MTISTTASATILGGNGVTSSFDFNFIAGVASNVLVTFTNTDGIESVLSPSQYNLTLNAPGAGQIWGIGGTVTYPKIGLPIAIGTSLEIQRIVPLTQLVSISNQGDFYPLVVEKALDTLCLEIQQVAARTGQIRGIWQTGINYNFGDIVQDGVNGNNTMNFYMCAASNESGVWANDLAAGDWSLAITSVLPMTPLPLGIPNGGTSAATAPAALTALGAAPIVSPTFTGTPEAPNPSSSDDSQQIATTHFVQGLVTGIAPAPAGAVLTFATNTAPSGWIECNGAAISRSTYSDLFTAIGTVFGVGDGSTTFNLPDMRGYFARGWDDGAGVDPARAFGSTQTDGFQDHGHATSESPHTHGPAAGFGNFVGSAGGSANTLGGSGGGGPFAVTAGAVTGLAVGGANSGNHTTETRPKNVALLYCIKT